jgi:hypothetical protein
MIAKGTSSDVPQDDHPQMTQGPDFSPGLESLLLTLLFLFVIPEGNLRFA